MKLFRIIVVLGILFVARCVVSCYHCPPAVASFYRFQQLSIQNLDHSGEFPVVTSSKPIAKEAFGLHVSLSILKTNNLSAFTPQAFAFADALALDCNCDYETFAPAQTITAIRVFSVNAFQPDIPANGDVSSRLKVKTETEYLPMDLFLQKLNVRYDNYLPDVVEFDLLLLQYPLQGGEYRFRIEVTLSDQTVLEAVSAAVQLI